MDYVHRTNLIPDPRFQHVDRLKSSGVTVAAFNHENGRRYARVGPGGYERDPRYRALRDDLPERFAVRGPSEGDRQPCDLEPEGRYPDAGRGVHPGRVGHAPGGVRGRHPEHAVVLLRHDARPAELTLGVVA